MKALPADLKTFWDHTIVADEAAEALARGLNDDEFFWKPDEGRRWSVALCLDHLAVTNDIYGAAIRAGVEAAKARGWVRKGPATPGFFGRKFANSLEPPVKRRTSAPGKIKPQPARRRDEIMRAYRSAHDEVRRLLGEAADVDVNRATFPNPFISLVNVRVSTGFHVIAAHDRRHLWQAQEVVKEMGVVRGA